MKNIFLTTITIIFLMAVNLLSYGQTDTIHFHNGRIEEATVIKIKESTISFKFKNEQAERSVSKYAVEKIKYFSGREEYFSQKIGLSYDFSWKNVIILNDKSEAEGLTKLFDMEGHTAFVNLHTSNTGQVKAREKILKSAANKKACFLLITREEETVYMTIKFWGFSQHKIKGIAYSY